MHDRPHPSGVAGPEFTHGAKVAQGRAGPIHRPLLHPLAGITLSRLTGLLIEHGGFSPRYAHQLAIIYFAGIARLPYCAMERFRVARGVREARFSLPPVFIVGHWRSGTTYLYNLLSRDPQFCFPSVTDALRPYEFFPNPFDFITRTLLLRSLPATRPMDDVPLHPDLPQEDELALATMGAPSFFNCFYFPKAMSQIFARDVLFHGAPEARLERWRNDLRYYLAKLSLLHGHRRLLIKNPAHSARLKDLRAMFPSAAFIHIHRDPADVLPSTRKLYRTMLPIVALQAYDMTAVERHIASSYPALMDTLLERLAAIPPKLQIEVAYNELVHAPLATVERIYRALGLNGFEEACKAMQPLVRSAGSVKRNLDPGDAAFGQRTADIIAPYRRRLGYLHDHSRAEAVQ